MPRRVHWALATLAAALLTACSPGSGPKTVPDQPAPPAGQPGDHHDHHPEGQAIGVSPAGVTTRVDQPAQSTEEQYAQACMTAKEWMDAKGGDPHSLVEPYLQEVQASNEPGRATFMTTWPDLSAAQQAGVILAVQAAADGGC
ncbi:MAG: lipoprotein LpqV [Mycobacterium sp.]|nr:lipoprotein LpqV [Mycobacterium sp.]